MSMTAKSVRPAARSFGASVESPGGWIVEVETLLGEPAALLRRVQPGVHRVRGEVEHERRLA